METNNNDIFLKLLDEIAEKTGLSDGEISLAVKRNRGYITQLKSRMKNGDIVPVSFLDLIKLRFATELQGGMFEEESQPYVVRRRNQKNTSTRSSVKIYGGFTNLSNITVYDDDRMKNEVIGELPPNMFPGSDYGEKAKGDSMYPIIMNQAYLVGKRCSVKGIVHGEKYIIKTKDGLDTTKYVHPLIDDDKKRVPGKFVLVAHNKSVPPQEVDAEDITFSCRVLFIINPT